MTISGYSWNPVTNEEDNIVTQYAAIPPCTELKDCVLSHVTLEDFYGLSSIRIEAIADGATLKSWVMDNLSMDWFDNSCAAGLKRVSSKK
jgi:hypothetical protein